MTPRSAGMALALLVSVASALSAQAPPPDADWRTFRSEHFRVTYQRGLEPVARKAAAVAERTHAVLSAELASAPEGVIDLVVVDHADYSNGFSTPFPSNRVTLFARPAATGEFFARDWIELVTVHELVHAFHVDQAGPVGRLVRSVLGRVSAWWPVFPVVATPTWSTEGLATHYESRLTGAGRIQAALHDMIVRTAALADAVPDLEDISAPSPVWPAGNRAYIYGGRFMRWVADRYGADAHEAIIDATAGSIWPTFFRFDHVAEGAVGEPFDDLYRTWRQETADSARIVAERVRAAGLTETRPVAGRGPYAVAPRVSPDGTTLAYTAGDWRSDPATRLVDLSDGGVRTLAERNQFGSVFDAASWLPDGAGVVVAQLEYHGPYRLFSDLWRVDLGGRERRMTRGLRLTQPDVGPDGRIAAIEGRAGALRLVVYDPATAGIRVLAEAAPGQSFDGPRWSPDGRRVAVAGHTDGRTDLLVLDASTGEAVRVTDDSPLDMAPAWSPDGRWLLWWSDRTGIPNIMAMAFRDGRPTGPVRQVTNVVTGVIDPEVSPDGRTLYLAAYHADGWRIEALPFDPASWREPPPAEDRYADAVLPAPEPLPGSGDTGPASGAGTRAADAGGSAGDSTAPGESVPYSPWPTLLPYHWLPFYEERGGDERTEPLRFIGAGASGRDVVGRHAWWLEAAADIETGRVRGSGTWVYRGLGSPELYLSAEREFFARGYTPDAGELVFQRESGLAIGGLLRRPGWRSSVALDMGAELRHLSLEGRDLDRAALEAAGDTLGDDLVLAGVSVAPTFGTARRYPLSISPENGVNVGVSVGRWWDIGAGAHAYDELSATAAGYLGVPVWGFANHVLAVRGRGFVRDGPLAPPRGVGGSADGDLLVALDAGSSYPVRGFVFGNRRGTRGWTANAEWRFPVHMPRSPGGPFGISLVNVSGALFLDAGNAWCPAGDVARLGSGCARMDPIASAGAELKLDMGIFHSALGRLAAGVAWPVQGAGARGGDRPVFYVGTAF